MFNADKLIYTCTPFIFEFVLGLKGLKGLPINCFKKSSMMDDGDAYFESLEKVIHKII